MIQAIIHEEARRSNFGSTFHCLTSNVVLSVLLAFPTASLVRADEWVLKTEFDNRFEGQIERLVGAADLELLSFTASFEHYDTQQPTNLNLGFYLPVDAPVFIRAGELMIRRFYRMQSKPAAWTEGAWNTFGPWETGAVLNRLHIAPGNLGITVRLGSQTSNRFAPALVWHSQRVESISRYQLVLRPGTSLGALSYQLLESGNGTQLLQKQLDIEQIAGQPFAVVIDALNLPAGELRLLVSSETRYGETGPHREYHFFHQPSLP